MLRIGSTESFETIDLFNVTSQVRYCEPGYLIYTQDKILLARAFDADNLKVTGEPIPIAEDIANISGSAISYFTISDEGTLVYMSIEASINNELIWVDRTGQEVGRIGKPDQYGNISLSPDGSKLVYEIDYARSETSDLWIYDLQRDIASRFTFDEKNEFGPFWSGDGQIVYYHQGFFPSEVTPGYKHADGTSEFTPLLDSLPYFIFVTDVSNDGSLGLFTSVHETQPDIEIKDLTGDNPMYPVVRTPLYEATARFSPDGRYFAYISQESIRGDLYLRRTDNLGGKWQVSPNGVRNYRWSHDGRYLYYFNWDWELFSVPISYNDGRVIIGTPSSLFSHELSLTGLIPLGRFDVTPDGQRFILVSAMQDAPDPEFYIVLNWFEALRNH
jgi:serine/threonine-protein kinase